ncbi:MAG TPA: translocation/assembly module TamB [Longimicrobiaceae bacterium]|nr:translocation/assembly module TamB [Longimicrobiaceae bacterium]
MTPLALRRLGLVVAGLLMGLFGLAFGLWFYLQAARVEEVRTQIGERVRIASEAIERIQVVRDSAIRITLRDVAIVGADGFEIVTAPRAFLTLDPATLPGDGPIEFYDVALIEPVANLVRSSAGVWNVMEAVGLTAAGQPVEAEGERAIVLRSVDIEDGRAVIAVPAELPDPNASFVLDLPLTTIGGQTYQRYTLTGIDATLPLVRFGGPAGWRVDIASLAAFVVEPEIQVAAVVASLEQEGEDGLSFDLEVARFGNSSLSGSGIIVFGDAGTMYDLVLEASPLQLADLRGFLPSLPGEGVARFVVDVESLSPERLALDFSQLDIDAMDSRILGRLSIAVGGEAPMALLDAGLELAPLDLVILERLGLVTDFPLLGQINGRVTTEGAPSGFAEVNLTGVVRPRNQPGVGASTVFANGTVAVGNAAEPMRMAGLTLSFQPLYLAALRDFAPEQADRLRGELRGSVTLAGTLTEIELAGGDLSYEVGAAPPSRLAGITGTISTQPTLSYRISALAQPLAMATLQELFPGLPVRATTLSGPIALDGTADEVEINAELTGPSGGLELAGTIAFGEPPTFDMRGRVNAFQAGMLLQPELPVEGPLTGTFALRGSMQQLAFNVDLTQADGRFTLAGSLNGTQETPIFQVAGEVASFRIGALLGDPALFPEPMGGSIDIRGGGSDPYIFDLDLAGADARLDISGVYEPGNIPRYNIQGFVDGLDLASLPFRAPLPRSSLTGQFDVEGRGLDLETLAGTYSFDFARSTLSGLELDEAVGRIEIAAGVAFVDTLQIQLEGTYLTASGSWGLQSPAAEPLRYRFVSPDLSAIARVFAPGELVPPRVAGRISAEGTIAGSIEYPDITAELEGAGLQYEDWRAQQLTMTLDAERDPLVGWHGDLSMVGDRLDLPVVHEMQALRVEASGSEASLALGLFASRDVGSDLALSGLIELEGVRPLGIGLETMTLRAGGVAWELMNPGRFRYVVDEGLLIENLHLERQGPEEGMILINGMLPPTGDAALRVTGRNIELGDLRQIVVQAPPIEGRLSLDGILEGPVTNPDLSVQGQVIQLSYEGVVTDSVTFDFDYSAGLLTAFAEASTGGQQLLDAELVVPMTLSMENRLIPAFDFEENAPLTMTIRADSLPLAVVAAMVPMLADGTGTARAQIDVGGTLDSPSLAGWTRVENGAVTVVPIETRYTGFQADIALSGNRAVINTFTITNGGPLRLGGSIAFPAGSPPQLDVTADFDGFLVMNDPQLAELIASGNVAIRGPTSSPVVTGRVEVEESTLRVPEMTQREPELELAYAEFLDMGEFGDVAVAGPPLVGNFRIDGLQVAFGESVWLESDDMRVQISGELVLYQAADDLRIFGALRTERGTYTLELSGIVRDFDVVSGRVQFFGTGDLNPAIDILARYRVPGGTTRRGQTSAVLINITGTLLAPRLQLSADAPVQLSEADLLSILFFGRPNFELAAFGPGVAGNLLVQELVGGLVASEIERPIVQAGLCDWVRVLPGTASDLRGTFAGAAFSRAIIECGWELAPSLYLTAEAGIGGLFGGDFTEGRISLEWQIDDEWMWEASYGALQRDPIRMIFDPSIQTQFSTDVTRRWEYGRPRQQDAIDLAPDTEPIPIEIIPNLPPVPLGVRDGDDPPVAAGTQ